MNTCIKLKLNLEIGVTYLGRTKQYEEDEV